MGRRDGISSRAAVLRRASVTAVESCSTGCRGGEGGQINKEEEESNVGLPREGGTAGAAALWPNSDEGRGSRCSSTLWTGSWC
jgi:hypothetical protein